MELSRSKDEKSEWQTSVQAELSKANVGLSFDQFETVQKVVKYQLDALDKFKKLTGAAPTVPLEPRPATNTPQVNVDLEDIRSSLIRAENDIIWLQKEVKGSGLA